MRMIYECQRDWHVDGVLVCKAGKTYEVADAQGEENEGYCDVLNCENGKTLETNWVEVGEYMEEYLICGYAPDAWNALSEEEQIQIQDRYEYDLQHPEQADWFVD